MLRAALSISGLGTHIMISHIPWHTIPSDSGQCTLYASCIPSQVSAGTYSTPVTHVRAHRRFRLVTVRMRPDTCALETLWTWSSVQRTAIGFASTCWTVTVEGREERGGLGGDCAVTGLMWFLLSAPDVVITKKRVRSYY
jgi:hypothetical protein